MNRIQLSPDSWIEEPDVIDTYDPASGHGSQMVGGYLYTRDPGIAGSWFGREFADDDAVQWRIPLSALPEVYGYRKGEPWVRIDDCRVFAGTAFPWSDEPSLHLNAAILCQGSADSLRTLAKVMEGWR